MYQSKHIKSYLVLGKGHPEGETIYVLRHNSENTEFELWNAKTGECSYFDKKVIESGCFGLTFGRNYSSLSISDSICQLKEVGSIITNENIYINLQVETNPSAVQFDFENQALWHRFLNNDAIKKYFPLGIRTIQSQIDNIEGKAEDAFTIQEEIFNYIKRQ